MTGGREELPAARVAGCRRSWPRRRRRRRRTAATPCARPSAYRSAAVRTRGRAGPCATAAEPSRRRSLPLFCRFHPFSLCLSLAYLLDGVGHRYPISVNETPLPIHPFLCPSLSSFLLTFNLGLYVFSQLVDDCMSFSPPIKPTNTHTHMRMQTHKRIRTYIYTIKRLRA